MSVRESAGETATYLLYRFMSWLGPIIPVKTGRSLYARAGRLFYRLATGTRAVVAANQAQVLGRPPEDPLVQASTREAFALYGRYWFDTFNILGWDEEAIAAAPLDAPICFALRSIALASRVNSIALYQAFTLAGSQPP